KRRLFRLQQHHGYARHRRRLVARRQDDDALPGSQDRRQRRAGPRAIPESRQHHGVRPGAGGEVLEAIPAEAGPQFPSCPRLSRASTSFFAAKAWMAGTSPAMTNCYCAFAFFFFPAFFAAAAFFAASGSW